MAKFHLPRLLHSMDSWKFFVEVIHKERHFYPSTTGNLESFRRNFPMAVGGAIGIFCRQIDELEVSSRGVIVLFKDGELVEGLQT